MTMLFSQGFNITVLVRHTKCITLTHEMHFKIAIDSFKIGTYTGQIWLFGQLNVQEIAEGDIMP